MRITLTLGMSGAAVSALHKQLLRASLDVPEAEVERELFGPGTLDALRAWQAERGLTPSGFVDEETERALEPHVEPGHRADRVRVVDRVVERVVSPAEPVSGGGGAVAGGGAAGEFEFLVRGQVMYRGGLPLSGIIVRAFNKDLRHEDLLAESRTDASGNFELWYNVDKLRRHDKRNPDLVVRAYSRRPPSTEIAASRVVYRAQTVEKVRLFVDGGPEHTWSEYEQLLTEVAPELEAAAIETLVENDERRDITYLAGRTGQDPQRIAALVVAHKLSARTGVPPDVLYGLARMGFATNLPTLLSQGAHVLHRALEAGVSGRLIPGRHADKADELHAALRRASVRYAMEGSGAPGTTSLGDLLAVVVPDAGPRSKFFETVIDHRGSTQDLWKKLGEDAALRSDVPMIQRALQLGALTDNHVPLVAELIRMQRTGEIRSVRELARLDEGAWAKIIRRTDAPEASKVPRSIPGETTEARIALYAATIRRIIADVLPTETVAYAAQADEAVPAPARALLANIVGSDTGFDLLRSNLREAVTATPALLEGVADPEIAVESVLRMQRVFRLAPRYEATSALMAGGIDSALSLVAMDRETFVSRFAEELGGRRQAQLTYNVASQTAAATLHVLADAGAAFNSVELAVLAPARPAGLPDLETLFGSLDLCTCAHCRSVFSPAAYLAELLAFLLERPLVVQGTSTNAREILFARRPDLGDVELTCDNTNVPLPYVDLVNELLEDAVAPFEGFDLAAGLAAELDARTISPALKSAFAARSITLGAEDRVVVVEPAMRWSITDHSRLYSLEKTTSGLVRVRSVAYQTKGSPQALAANPEHQNDAAYSTLRAAIFPWSLPFDLPWEEARAYLAHLRVARHELMEDLAPGTRAEVLRNADVAAEMLGIPRAERDLIVGTSTTAPWDRYGLRETGNQVAVFDPANPATPATRSLGWLDALAQVRVLQDRAGLSYAELVTLLEARFVGGAGAIRIVSADPADLATCDSTKLVVTGLDAPAADRLHRFVRLQRRLGWSARELDQAIAAFGGTIDARLLERASHVQRLRAATALPVEVLLAWWSDIDLHGDDPPSLYRRLFQDPTVAQPVDPAFTLAAGELAIVAANPADAKISRHSPPILAALEITAADLRLLVDELGSDELSLASLSWLYRHAQLARAAGLSIEQTLVLASLAGIDPFDRAHTENAILFLELAASIAAAGVTIEALDHLLRHRASAASVEVSSETAIATQLDQLRRALQQVHEATEPEADPSGDITRRQLALLAWPPEIVSNAVELLAGRAAYDAPLAALPAGLVVPAGLRSRTTHDAAAGRLRITGPLTIVERDDLRAASTAADWRGAVDAIHAAPRDLITRRMKAYVWPTFSTHLAAFPAGVTIPRELRSRLVFDAPAGALRMTGVMTESERAALRALSADVAWRAAVDALFAAPDAHVPSPAFLTAADAAALLDEVVAPEARFALVLTRLLGYLRNVSSVQAVLRFFADALALELRIVEELLTRQISSIATVGGRAIADFLAPEFALSHHSVALTATSFPAQFGLYLRLQKAASLVSSFRLTAAQLSWLAEHGPTVPARQIPWVHTPRTVRWLPFDDLPVAPIADGTDRFAAWLRLAMLARVRSEVPDGEETLSSMFSLARRTGVTAAVVLADLAARTGWATADLGDAAAALGLSLPADLRDEVGLARLQVALRRARRLGVSVARCGEWARATLTGADARAVRNAVKARYSEAEWLVIARPLRDVLREKQRSALVGYLVARPDPARGRVWSDVDGLYAHLLIDVQMGACMATSRIKQAISSVQLFVQRTFLNLEQPRGAIADVSKDAGWSQWRWMKSYRLWEANRKVFLYPENWIEPELRRDKTALFQGLESALLEGDVTAERAEDAFMSYLEGLNTTARLEVAGLYQQDAVADQPAVLHVIARTLDGTPAYYYRRRVAEGRWTEWERIEVDITERQILPIVWNSRLFLFWPELTEVQDPQPIGDKPTAPTPRWLLQIAWTERHHDRWTAKRLTPDKIPSNLQPDSSRADRGKGKHTFRAAFDGPGLRVWYEYDVPERTVVVAPPQGYYGPITKKVREATVKGWFFTGCDGRIELFDRIINGVFPPAGTTIDGMFFTEAPSSPLSLPKTRGGKTEDVVLLSTPGTFNLAYAHQDGAITARRPFFYQDQTRSFFVTPEDESVLVSWIQTERVHPAAIDVVRRNYYAPRKHTALTPPAPRPGLLDPVPVVRFRAEERARARARARAARTTGAGAVPPPGPAAPATEVATPAFPRSLAVRAAKGLTAPRGAYVLARGDRARLRIDDYVADTRLFAPVVSMPMYQIELRYRFWTFYHPYVCDFIKELNWHKLDGLFKRDQQLRLATPFKGRYSPTAMVDKGDPAKEDHYPRDDVDFSAQGAYAQYNWELFFHAPLLIATRLSQNQKFREAQEWFHYIFDPTDASGGAVPQKYWRTRPFYETSKDDYLKQRIDRLIELASRGIPDEELDAQIREWRANPFEPHLIACLRTTAYQKAVVMKYLDNLIAWGDQLFRRNTIETINEATQLYVLAAEILGRRPETLAPRAEPVAHTYRSLAPELRRLSNRLVEIEQVLPPPRPDSVVVPSDAPPLSVPKLLYFCVPPNDKLLGYWTTVADRLFKIRHCMSIEGVVQRLPLFEPPIDPALLVRAAAAGIDLTTALSDLEVGLPIYRFRLLATKASELIGEVRGLGATLLAALEKRDAEEVALLRARHEIGALDAITAERQRQVDEAKQNIVALRAQRHHVSTRYVHYQKLLGVASPAVPAEGQPIPEVSPGTAVAIQSQDGLKITQYEAQELVKLDDANRAAETASDWEFVSALLSIIPTIGLHVEPWGIGGSISFGGNNLAGITNAIASRSRSKSASATHDAARSARLGSHLLRENDWALQSNLAAREMMQLDAQIVAAQLRQNVAEIELDAHRTRIEQAKAIEELLRDKYTNKELFDWMVARISAVFFQAYQLAYDLARRAERSYRFELGVVDSSFIQFGYWDSLKKGLLAGERLALDLKRLELAYLEQNRREYELTKHVSLALLHPEALLALQETGACTVEIPEAIFEVDNPGHYLRRIRSVSLSIPCVAGPYTTVSCKLTLVASRIRRDTSVQGGYAWTGAEDRRFTSGGGSVQSVVTSSGRDDTGTFELDPRDDRYLPFEGAGAISTWTLELPSAFRQFDYRTISDVVLRLRYTARDGGEPLKQAALSQLGDALKAMEVEEGKRGIFRLFSMRRDFPDEWYRLMQKARGAAAPAVSIALASHRFLHTLERRALKVQRMAVFAQLDERVTYDDGDRLTLSVKPPGRAAANVELAGVDATRPSLAAGALSFGAGVAVTRDDATSAWELSVSGFPAALSVVGPGGEVRLDPEKLADVAVLCQLTF